MAPNLGNMTDTQLADPDVDAPAEAPADQATNRPTFTITEAAAACAVSRKTITRKLVELADAGAAKDADGFWRIPVEALLSVGLHPGRSLPPATREPASPVLDLRPKPSVASAPVVKNPPEATEDVVTIRRDRWDDIRIRLARAEAESVERGRALDDARLALRALTAGPAPLHVANGSIPPVEPTPGPAAAVPATSESGAPGTSGEHSTPVPSLDQMPRPADDRVWDTLLPKPPVAPLGHQYPVQPGGHAPGYGRPLDPTATGGQAGVVPFADQSQYSTGYPQGGGAPVRPRPRRHWWGGRISE